MSADEVPSAEIPIEQAVQRVLDAANGMQGTDVPPALRDAIHAFMRSPDHEAGRLQIAERIRYVSAPQGAGFLSVWLGGGVENGHDPEPAIPHLIAAMLRWSRTITLPDPDEEDSANETPLDEATLSGLSWLGQGLVAHLARSPEARARYGANEEVLAELERVESVSKGCLWVGEILRKRSGRLLVLHVEGATGVRVTYENLSNGFHLFTLLQGALAGRMPGAGRVSEEAVAIARGERDGDTSDSAWWHYGPGTVPEANLVASIWGEASPDQIPVIDGEQVILLWPMQVGSRSWTGSFFTPRIEAAPARVTVVEELTPEEFETWRTKLKLPHPSPRPWWKFW